MSECSKYKISYATIFYKIVRLCSIDSKINERNVFTQGQTNL